MKNFVRFVTHWRVELVLAAMVLSLTTPINARPIGADWCSDNPVLSYFEPANTCMGSASDCYMCVVWAP